MKAPFCVACNRIAIDLCGQVEKLDSFYLEPGGPPPETAGVWHLACLSRSGHGQAWTTARLDNHIRVRRNEVVAQLDTWTVVRNPRTREVIAFSSTGESLGLEFVPGKPGRVNAGAIYRVEEEFNLELSDVALVRVMQDALVSVGTFPVLALLEALGIGDTIVHPEALEGGLFRYDRSLREHWYSDAISVRADYGVYVPSELQPFVTQRPPRR